MHRELSTSRLYSMRFLYLLTGVVLGSDVWPTLLTHAKPWDPLHGVAFSFWAAYSLLMLVGVRFPVRMLPLMLLQLLYKVIWLIAVGYPLWWSGHLTPLASGLISACAIGAFLDLIVIPWPYVFESYAPALSRLASDDDSPAPGSEIGQSYSTTLSALRK